MDYIKNTFSTLLKKSLKTIAKINIRDQFL